MSIPKLRAITGGRKKAAPKVPRSFHGHEDVKALAVAKLASSGLTLDDAKALGISWHDRDATNRMATNLEFYPSLRIPYWDPFKPDQPLAAHPNFPQFYRVRYLWQPSSPAEAEALKKAGKEYHKYNQPKGTGVCAYFPPTVDWAAVNEDIDQGVIITEGELKAAAAAKHGLRVIGLGGVNSIYNRGLGVDLLAELDRFRWCGMNGKGHLAPREVCIIFDSDVASNPKVSAALQRIAEEIYQRGGAPSYYMLEPREINTETNPTSSTKCGLDDFLLDHGVNAADQLRDRITSSQQSLTLARLLFLLNEEYVFISQGGLIVKVGDPRCYLYKPDNFDMNITSHIKEAQIENGKTVYKPVLAGKRWRSWGPRATVARIEYIPGRDPLQITATDDGTPVYNIWRGWGVEPKQGSVEPFLDVIRHLFTGVPWSDAVYFLQWLAYPLQHPGAKMATTAVLHGRHHGTGKSLVGETMKRIYGQNYYAIGQGDLEQPFNHWANGRQFVMGDDVTGSNKKHEYDKLKTMITRTVIPINIKNVPHYDLQDTINYFWTSNRGNSFFLDDEDRRFFVHEVTVEPLPDVFYQRYFAWLDADGASYLFHYLLNLDLAGFNPNAHAPRTEAKTRMTRLGRGDLASWVREVIESPEEMLSFGQLRFKGDIVGRKALFAAAQAFFSESGVRLSPHAVTKAFIEAGAREVNFGRPIRREGDADRYLAIRNGERWNEAALADLHAHLDGPPEPPKPVGKKRAKF